MDLSVGFFTSLLLIIFIDLALSGDNAVVIAMAANRLRPDQRKQAIIWGVAGAIIFRILATIFVVFLLGVPYLRAVGGGILMYIAYKLLLPEEEEGNEDSKIKASSHMFKAICIIVIADISMAFDNMLGVAGVSDGKLGLVIFGLLLSMPITVLGSTFIMKALDKLPWLIYVGSGVLAYTAIHMIFQEPALASKSFEYKEVIYTFGIALVLLAGYISRSNPQ